MPFSEVLKPAINYATKGFGVSKLISESWKNNTNKLLYRPSGAELLPGGKAPEHGELVNLPELGRSFEIIAEGGSEAFYKGEIGKKLVNFISNEGGWITEYDMHNHRSDWDEPITTNYRGVDVWECPPNGQGIAALMSLNIVENFDISKFESQSVERYHYLIESMRLGYSDALHYVADPRKSNVPINPLLSKTYAKKRMSQIDDYLSNKNISYGDPIKSSDTVYLTVVDKNGMACSLINSLFSSFGSGLVVPTTGIALQNRGSLFSLEENHLNYLLPQKRPFQTIIPAMATKDSELWLSFGVMGGFQQPQGQLQVISNMVDHNMDSQKALDSLRFSVDVDENGHVLVESDLDQEVVKGLRAKGHDVTVVNGYERILFGGGQIISRDSDTGLLTGGSEPRKDGAAIGY